MTAGKFIPYALRRQEGGEEATIHQIMDCNHFLRTLSVIKVENITKQLAEQTFWDWESGVSATLNKIWIERNKAQWHQRDDSFYIWTTETQRQAVLQRMKTELEMALQDDGGIARGHWFDTGPPVLPKGFTTRNRISSANSYISALTKTSNMDRTNMSDQLTTTPSDYLPNRRGWNFTTIEFPSLPRPSQETRNRSEEESESDDEAGELRKWEQDRPKGSDMSRASDTSKLSEISMLTEQLRGAELRVQKLEEKIEKQSKAQEERMSGWEGMNRQNLAMFESIQQSLQTLDTKPQATEVTEMAIDDIERKRPQADHTGFTPTKTKPKTTRKPETTMDVLATSTGSASNSSLQNSGDGLHRRRVPGRQ